MQEDDRPPQETPQAELFYGQDQLKYGEHALAYGGDLPDFLAEDVIGHLSISAEYPDGSRIDAWTGLGELQLDGITYTGVDPDVIDVSIGSASEKEDSRLQIRLGGIEDPEIRRQFLEFRGRVQITVRLVYSTDGGVTWRSVPRFFRGLLSRPVMTRDSYSFEVATYREDLDRGYELVWSDEQQQHDYPIDDQGGDLFFAHIKTLADGIRITWPP